uniref:Uncharacterized protein n=1 Tax=Rhizophora mucronata TaxID=61149 RepID=A0A2P2LR20_RHIMU
MDYILYSNMLLHVKVQLTWVESVNKPCSLGPKARTK